jgi:hypothetical protein
VTIDAYTGSTVTLDATFTDTPGGTAVDPTSVSLSVLDSDGNVDFGPYTYAGGTVTKVAVGFYRKALAIPSDTEVGAYTVAWTVVIDGDTRIGYETLNITEGSATPTADAGPYGVWYCTREDVKAALDIAETARSNRRIDRAIETASRSVEGLLRRRFYPAYATRTFDWPDPGSPTSWRLWLDANEVVSVTTLTAGGTTIASGDYLLRPDHGPPYTHIEIDLGSSAAFASGDTHQRAISITGVFGYRADETVGAETVEAVDASETAIDVDDSSIVGVGSILRIDSERMIVTAKTQLDTAQDLQTALTASMADDAVTVTDGTGYEVGEVILLDSEKMLVVDIVANDLIVKRAWDGTVLAAHDTDADIYAPRTLTVTRGALGTTAASHSSGATVYVHQAPGPIRDLTVAYALNQLAQESSGYARTVGSGDAQMESSGKGLKSLQQDALVAHGRQLLTGAV